MYIYIYIYTYIYIYIYIYCMYIRPAHRRTAVPAAAGPGPTESRPPAQLAAPGADMGSIATWVHVRVRRLARAAFRTKRPWETGLSRLSVS